VLITNNRNDDSPDSLEATIRQHNTPNCLPVFTIGNLDNFRLNRAYAEQVLKRLFEYLLDIDSVRGTGRLFSRERTPRARRRCVAPWSARWRSSRKSRQYLINPLNLEHPCA
jgi:hypothetical protein